MVFAPKLSEGVAFNQPVQQPNAMEAIAGLFDFGLKVATKSGENALNLLKMRSLLLLLKSLRQTEVLLLTGTVKVCESSSSNTTVY